MHKINLYLFFILSIVQLSAQTNKDSTLRVGFAGSEPFVMVSDEAQGIAPDIWKEIAFNAELDYEFSPFASINDGIAAIQSGELDALIGPITINSQRAQNISFSQPFFDTEMGILAPVMEQTLWDRIKPLFSTNFLIAVISFLLLLTFVGLIFWLVEGRKYPEEYGNKPSKGIGSGIWLALVTMTTVGYGDMAPKTPAGRVVIGSWMIISLIMATSFIAGIATTLSLTGRSEKTITELGQLEGKKVAVPNYKKMLDNFKAVGGTPITVNNVEEGYKLLTDDGVDALVYDIVPLEYIANKAPQADFKLSKRNINPQHYGFVFPLKSELRHTVNLEILKLKESGDIDQIITGYVQ
ncbi:amino acid ABC transporter substrate-binding protein, PAAT family [Pricia antarctica]|uniref:Amino acid ABC transporter substrate-binding protein, PAAT family n=1 Tax=Pricia antarctica TaxID=641691 RepID=A0A1G7H7A7_9FLAO|nr:transporter substrate-binding domain-containing protein [Pricia antarctica]SDE96154.1 amino acid ABC transporter substrate-binding protein, PAAT family [Pricia antarctica]